MFQFAVQMRTSTDRTGCTKFFRKKYTFYGQGWISRWYGKKRTFQPISKFQEEKRDLAFVMDKNISCGDVENCIREANKYVKEIRLFDVYEGGQIPEGKKSMAFTVTFAPKEEAFDFEKVQKFVEKICKKLQNEFNIELRG